MTLRKDIDEVTALSGSEADRRALEIVAERLADMYEVMSQDDEEPERPPVPDGEALAAWVVRSTPVLADYALFARRANRALEETLKTREVSQAAIRESEHRVQVVESLARDDRRLMVSLRSDLESILTRIDSLGDT